MSLAEVAAVTGGRLHRATGAERVTGVEFDSRKVGAGGLFLALPGERVDGHGFAAAAVAAGAVGVLAAREVEAPAVIVPPAEPGSLATGSYLAATDPDGAGAAVLAALARLATHNVAVLRDLVVVGVTGSSGKTSTKDLLAAVLAPLGPTIAPPGSFNNELGLPWTALQADTTTRHLVLELSARGRGHIAALCRVARPRIGVVLNVGRAHLGEFGSPEAIAEAKGELVEALPAGSDDTAGVAVLNADDPAVAAMATRTRARVVSVGRTPDATVRAEDLTLAAGRPRFRLVAPQGSAEVALRLVGAHHVGNALSAAAVALECGATPEGVAAALSAAGPASRWRMEVTDRADGVTVINDAYNANPESMRAALQALAALGGGPSGPRSGSGPSGPRSGSGPSGPRSGSGPSGPRSEHSTRRTWAVLGPMAELGGASAAAHAEVAAAAAELGVDHLVTVGDTEYGRGRPVADVAAALDLLRAELEPGDVVLVKASRAVGLDRLADALVAVSDQSGREPVA